MFRSTRQPEIMRCFRYTALRSVLAVRCAAFALRHFSQSREERTVVWLPHPSEPCLTAQSASRHTQCGLLALRVTVPDTLCCNRVMQSFNLACSLPAWPFSAARAMLPMVSRYLT